MRRRWEIRNDVQFARVTPGHQLATLYGKGVGVELRGRNVPLRLNVERSLDGPGWAITPAYSVGGVEQAREVIQASATLVERQMIHGPHESLAAAKAAIREAHRASYCRAAIPRLRAAAEKSRDEARRYDEQADKYLALYGEATS